MIKCLFSERGTDAGNTSAEETVTLPRRLFLPPPLRLLVLFFPLPAQE